MKRLELWKVITTYLLTVLGYLPWLLPMITAFRGASQSFWIGDVLDIKDGLFYFFAADREWYSWMMFGLTILFVLILILLDKKVVTILKKDDKIDIQLSTPTERISDMSFWLLWGVIAALGTLVFGELISVLIRPLFITRYLYPVVIVIWMVLSVGVTRLTHLKRIMVPIILIITLFVCIPHYVVAYKTGKSENEICMATEKYMDENIKETDVMLTNGSHLAWTVLSYYVPGVAFKHISSGFSEFDANTTYWLVWTGDISEEEAEWLDEYGYSVTEVYHAGLLGSNSIHLYQMDRK